MHRHLTSQSSFWVFLFVKAMLSVVSPTPATFASQEVAIQVAQPIWTENAIVISRVTYVRWLGSPVPGIEIAWTASPNLIEREGDASASNRNAAALYGISVRTKLNSKWKDWPRDFADTLGITLDLSRLARPDSSWYPPEEHVVKATVECILINAGRSRPAIKFIALEVEGGQEFSPLAKVYPVGLLPGVPVR